jgi:hypothetical protein
MCVVDKISQCEYVEDIVIQYRGWKDKNKKRTFIYMKGIGKQIEFECESSLEATYLVVVEFIKWYNQYA